MRDVTPWKDHPDCIVYFLVVCFGMVEESWIKLSPRGGWSHPLAHAGLIAEGKIRLDF